MQEYQKLVPQMKERAAAVPALQDCLKEAAGRFGSLLSSAQFEKAREALGDLTNLIQGAAPAAAPGAKEEANQLFAAYQKLVPDMKSKGTQQPALQAPLMQTAKAFQDALKAGRLDEANRMLNQLAQILATPAPAAAETPPPADGLGQEFAKRYGALKPRLEQALRENRGDTGKMRAGLQFAIETANEKQYDRALKALDQIEKLLQAGAGAAPETSAAMKQWQAERSIAITKLNEVARQIADAKHPQSDNALMELKAVIANITAEPNTLQKVLELEAYLDQDDVVLDICQFSEDIRTPLLGVLAQLKTRIAG
jgi:hypothetical protein